MPCAFLTQGEHRKAVVGTLFMQIELFGPGSASLLEYLLNAQIAVNLSRTPHFPTPDPGARFRALPSIPPWREFLHLSSDAAASLGNATALLGWRASRSSRLIQVTTGQGDLVELRGFSAEQAAVVLRDARKIVAFDTRKPGSVAFGE